VKKVAVPVQNNLVSAHFGHAPEFKIYSVENNDVIEESVMDNPGHQPGLLPRLLKEAGADIIISGGMGQKAITIFEQNDIAVICGASGKADKVIEEYIEGNLESEDNRCSHGENHNHDHHHHS